MLLESFVFKLHAYCSVFHFLIFTFQLMIFMNQSLGLILRVIKSSHSIVFLLNLACQMYTFLDLFDLCLLILSIIYMLSKKIILLTFRPCIFIPHSFRPSSDQVTERVGKMSLNSERLECVSSN